MKTYVIMISRHFPTWHPKAGEVTKFTNKILSTFWNRDNPNAWKKIHTIQENYDLWLKRISEVQSGKAVLSLRFWDGKPYKSTQTVLIDLTKDDNVGIQRLEVSFIPNKYFMAYEFKIDGLAFITDDIAYNEGLTKEDFCEWFRRADFSKPFALIHFTPKRYGFTISW